MALSAARREDVRALLPELEDAFRTASWPGGGSSGAVILVRRLDLGRIARGSTRQALALRLASAAGQVSVVRVTADAPVPAEAEALIWPDRVELLAAALTAAPPGTAGPWWARMALAPGAPATTAASVDAAARRLVREAGAETLAALVLRLLAIGAPRQSLVALAPVIGEAARAIMPADALPVAAVGRKAEPGAAGPAHASSAPPALPFAADDSPLPGLLPPEIVRALRSPPVLAAIPAATRPALATIVAARVFGRAALPALIREATRRHREVHEPDIAAPAAPPAGGDLPGHRHHAGRARTNQAPPAASDASQQTTGMQRAGVNRTPPVANGQPDHTPEPDPVTWLGGLPVLINLINRAGLPRIDEGLGADLSLAVLLRLSGALHEDDPVRAALPPGSGVAPSLAAAPAFAAEPWLLAAGGMRFGLVPVPGRPGLRLLVLRPGLLAIGLVDRPMLTAAARAAGRRRFARLPAKLPGDPANHLIPGLAVLLRRALTGLGARPWRQALLRPGYAAVTATHLDITLDLDAVHLPERRAGLDLTPGWVPWLGRVVALHFERFAKQHGGSPQ